MSRHNSLLLEGFTVETKNDYEGRTRVAIEFFYVATKGVGRRSFICRDIRFYVAIGNGHNKGFVVATKLGQDGRTLSQRLNISCHERQLAKGRIFPIATEYFMLQQRIQEHGISHVVTCARNRALDAQRHALVAPTIGARARQR